jgi:uncharacterized caspase-like protein
MLAMLLLTVGPVAAAEKRVALVIGNAAYVHSAALKTPANDARLVAKSLREIGFTDVLERYDVGIEAMTAALNAFGARAEGADWALIYYAGHGLERAGRFYLAPTDARLAGAAELESQTITLERLLAKPARVRKLRLVILDMPRADPFGPAARPRLSAAQEPSLDGDTLLAFATQPGNVLAQSAGDNGAYALALVRNMATPGADIRDVFDRVREDVLKATSYKQVPWTTVSLSGPYEFKPAVP